MSKSILASDARPHIVLFRLSALGDVVMWVPVIKAILRQWPEAKITWVIARPFDTLLDGLPGVRFVVLKKSRRWSMWRTYYQQLKSLRADILLLGQASLRAHLMSRMIRAKRRIGFGALHANDAHAWFVHEQVPALPEHLADSFMQFARYLGVVDCSFDWTLPIGDADNAWAADKMPGGHVWVAINAAASNAERDWPVDRLIACMQALQNDDGLAVVLTGGPCAYERELAEKLAAASVGVCVNLVGQTSLKQLAAVLSRASIALAPDTGPLHIASAVGTPVVGLHAVVPAIKSGAHGYLNLAVDHYAQAVPLCLNKPVSEAKWGERIHDKRAMALITIEDVLEKCRLALFQANQSLGE